MLQAVGDETVVLDPITGNYFTLDPVGTRLIELYRASTNLQTTAERMAEEFDESAETIHTHLIELLENMVRNGLAHKSDPSSQ